MRLLLLFISFFIWFGNVFSQQLRIGVYRDYDIKKIVFSYKSNNYSVFGDGKELGTIHENEFVELLHVNKSKIELKIGVVSFGLFSKINLIETEANSSLTLNPTLPILKKRNYQNDFEILAGNKGFTLINVVDMNNYLNGVVESEGGGGKHLEYYKVQAVMSRTYVLKYKNKHSKEGFELCDRVHCQAYHSMLRFTQRIDTAVHQTDNVVLKDIHGNLVDTYFHANCGGQTSEADYVWNNAVPYLNSFKDTFCIYTNQSYWEKRIPKHIWADFLIRKYNYPINDSIFGPLLYTFTQDDRLAFYQSPILGIPLRDIRNEFKLKSTFFSCYLDENEVVISGRGNGHGVGLCQEGAMHMAKYGFNYVQIAQYYFPGVYVTNLTEDCFYHQKGNFLYCEPIPKW